MDFGVLPPEVTSGQLYSGAGSGPLMAAAAAWDVLGGQVGSFAQDYASLIAELQGGAWAGSAAAAMAAAAGRYAQWAAVTGGQAEQAAAALRGAAGAFEAAHAAITPPEVVAANRAQLMQLIATNVLGQNAARIAAVEAAYQGMWAQNTAVMYGYAGSASSASRLAPFQHAPQTTNPAAGTPATPALPDPSLTSSVLQGLSTPGSAASANTSSLFGLPIPNSLLGSIGTANTLLGPVNFYSASFRSVANGVSMGINLFRLWADGVLYAPLAGLTSATTPAMAGPLPAGTLAATSGSAADVSPVPEAAADRAVLASVGASDPIGPLSVPHAWAEAVPAGSVANNPVWVSGIEELFDPVPSGAGGGSGPDMGQMAAMAAAGLAMRPIVGNMLRVPPRNFKMPRPSGAG